MRTIQVFILRLLVDTENPETLRGVLQPVAEGAPQPFANEQALLDLLHGMLNPEVEKEKSR